jgi:hypothetical protein
MAKALEASGSSVGTEDVFTGNFTKALYLRSHPSAELELRLGYGPGRLSDGWWLLFAIDPPSPSNFEFGGYTHFSGSCIGNPNVGGLRPHVEEELLEQLGPVGLWRKKVEHVAALEITGPQRLAKVLPVKRGNDYPVGSGIYQCNIPRGIRCKVAAYVAPGQTYLGNYT